MAKASAGLLVYKFSPELKVFLVHPGGLFWKDKDKGAWSIPKGEIDNENDKPLEVAKREMFEETGIKAPKEKEKYLDLGEITQKSGKVVHAWAFEGDWFGLLICKSFVEMEFKGKKIRFPEVDKAGFFSIEKAKEKINERQFEFVGRLIEMLENKK